MRLTKLLSLLLTIMIVFSFIFLFLHKIAQSSFNSSTIHITGFIYLAILIIYGWIFGTIALLLAKKENINLPILNKPNRYFVFNLLFPIVILIISITISLLIKEYQIVNMMQLYMPNIIIFNSMSFNLIFISFILVLCNIINGLITAFCVMLGGELMWRGYLLNKVKTEGFWIASLYTGILFSLWSIAPLLFGDLENIFLKIPETIMIAVLISPLMVYMRIKGRSLIVPATTYSFFVSIGSIGNFLFSPNIAVFFSSTGLLGICALLLVNFYLYTQKLPQSFLSDNLS